MCFGIIFFNLRELILWPVAIFWLSSFFYCPGGLRTAEMLSGGKLEVEKLEDLNWDSIREAVHVWKEVDDFLTENPDMMQKLEVDRSELSATAAFLISLGNRARTLKAAATDQLAQKLTEGSQRTIGGSQSSDEQVNTQAAPAKANGFVMQCAPSHHPKKKRIHTATGTGKTKTRTQRLLQMWQATLKELSSSK